MNVARKLKLAAACVIAMTASLVSAEPSFTVMRNCRTVADLQRVAVADDLRRSDCRLPRNKFEQRLIALASYDEEVKQCIVTRSPAGLEGWSCARLTGPKDAVALTCWVPRNEDDAKLVRTDYDKYGPRIAQYLQAANACPTSHHDAASVGFKLTTNLRYLVSNQPLTFAEQLESGRRVRDILIEGYALVNEDLAQSPDRHIHYLILGANWNYRRMGAEVEFNRKDGPWVIEDSDHDPNLARLVRVLRARVPVDAKVFFSALGISRSTAKTRPDDERRALLDLWQQRLSEQLEHLGYTRLSEAEFRRLLGVSSDEYRRRIIQAQPVDERDAMAQQLGRTILLRRTVGSCENEPNLVAGVMILYGDRSEAEDYGQLIVDGVAASKCMADLGDLGRDQEQVLKSAIANIEQLIRRTP